MRTVGIRELKNSLSKYLRYVRAGERVEVTDRGEVVGVIVPASRAVPVYASRLDQLIAEGKVKPAERGGDPLGGFRGLGLPPGTAARLIDEDRDEA